MDETTDTHNTTDILQVNTLNVSSDSLSSILTNGGVKIGQTLNVNGCTTIKGTTDLRGNTNMKSNCNIQGDLMVKNTNITGDIIFQGDIKSSKTNGKIELHSKTRILNTSEESLYTYGGLIIEKNCKINGTLNASCFSNGKFKLKSNGDIFCNDIESLGNLSSNNVSFKNCTIESVLSSDSLNTGIINGTSLQLTGDIKASNILLKNMECVDIKSIGKLYVKDSITSEGSINITGNLTVNKVDVKSVLNVYQECNINSSLSVTKDTVLSGSISVGEKADIKGDVLIGGSIISRGNLCIDDTTESTSTNTGALIVRGGISVEKNLFINGSCSINSSMYLYAGLSVFGKSVISSTIDSVSPNTGSLVLSGGMGIMKSLNVEKNLSVQGELKVENGVKMSNGVYITSTEDSVSFNSGALIIKGGTSISKSLMCGGNVLLMKQLDIMGQVEIKNNQDSSNYKTGALIVTGGVGITKNVYCNENIHVKDTVITEKLSVTEGILNCNNVKISDINGLCTISSNIISGLRLCGNNEMKQTRYYTSIDLFSLGNVYTDTNVEALQISNDDNGDYNIVTRSVGSGKTGDLRLKSGYSGGSVEMTSEGQVKISGSEIVLQNSSKTASIKLIFQDTNDTTSDTTTSENTNFTLILPKTGPPKGVKSTLVCDENGELIWMELK